MNTFKLLTITCAMALLGACATVDDDPTQDWSGAKLYEEAKAALDRGYYQTAIEYYETLEARYPFGRYAQQAQIEGAYAYYKFNELDSAIAAADRFIKLHPLDEHADYAWYLKGLANFDRTRDYFDFLMDSNPSENDPTPMIRAFDDFAYLIRNYPDSRYVADARQRMVYLRNELAEYELHVADYYMRRGAWVAAANRGKYVVEHYEGAESMPAALGVMITAYRRLGLNDLAVDATRVLRLNFPERASKLLAARD